MKNTQTGNVMISDNPNQISAKAYDGKTQYLGFLGWALPEADFGSCAKTASLDSLVSNSFVSSSVKVLSHADAKTGCE